jgi:hypothetical protein
MMKILKSYEIFDFFLIFKFSNFLKLLNFKFFLEKMLTPYWWYIDPPTHEILTPPTHGISTPQPMVFWLPCPWNIDPPTYGISNPLLWYYELLSFGRNEGGGGSIYHEGVQNTMTKNWPRGQNTIWKIEPGVKKS